MHSRVWETDFSRLASEWETICEPLVEPYDVNEWTSSLLDMRGVMLRLQDAGRWAAGPHDLMSIVGLNRWELAHSAAIRWLCTPDAGHGLGAKFLEYLLSRTGEPVHHGEPVTTAVEESRLVAKVGTPAVPFDEQAGPDELLEDELPFAPGGVLTRADIVVRGSAWTLLVEVKVDAGEQQDQAQRLYDGWKNEEDARFIFLSRPGLPPSSIDPDLRHLWTGLAWGDLRSALERLAEEGETTAVARPALLDYILTLRTTF